MKPDFLNTVFCVVKAIIRKNLALQHNSGFSTEIKHKIRNRLSAFQNVFITFFTFKKLGQA